MDESIILRLIPLLWSMRDALHFRKAADASRKSGYLKQERLYATAAYNHSDYVDSALDTYADIAFNKEAYVDLKNLWQKEMQNPTKDGIYNLRERMVLAFSNVDSDTVNNIKFALYSFSLKCNDNRYKLHNPGESYQEIDLE